MQVEPAAPSQSDASLRKTVDLSDRLLTEAVGALERLHPSATNDPLAEQIGRSVTGDLERKMIVYAKSLPVSMALQDALRYVRHAIVLMILAAVVLAAAAGVAAARAALATSRDEPVNFFWALGAVLGVQTLLLLVWIAVMISARRAISGPMSFATLGGLVMRGAQFVAARIHKGPEQAAAIAATGAVHLRGPIGKWTIASISHGVWVVFNITCLLTLIVALSARKYTFAWETTILSEAQYVPLTRAIAALPRAAGFYTPSDEQIAASQWRGQSLGDDLDANQAWSGLLIGSLVLYGFGPRLLLFAYSLGRRRYLASKYRIDTDRDQFARLRSILNPPAASIGVVDGDDSGQRAQPPAARHAVASSRAVGGPAILGFELPSKPGAAWPPALHQVHWDDMGMVDSRDDQRRVLQRLQSADTEPRTVAVVFALTATPDRGAAAFLRELAQAVSRPVTIILTAGESLRKRSSQDQTQQRIDDWHALATSAGIPPQRVVEIDLDHMTQASAAKLGAIVGADGAAADPPPRRLESAFDLIARQAVAWSKAGSPAPDAEQAELHRRIAKLYEHDRSVWRDFFMTGRSVAASASQIDVSELKVSAARVLNLLPANLRASPKWIAAGATAGALGCITAAALISPVAIAALPVWSAIGGSISGVIALSRSSQPGPQQIDEAAAHVDALTPIRSAALFAMLLELQGRDEKLITRVLDAAISPRDDLSSFDAAQRWLDQLRHRFDLALAREVQA